MLLKKIAILSSALIALGFLTAANADYEHHDDRYRHSHDRHHHHDRFCKRVVYHKVCHGPYHYQRCHMERREYWAC